MRGLLTGLLLLVAGPAWASPVVTETDGDPAQPPVLHTEAPAGEGVVVTAPEAEVTAFFGTEQAASALNVPALTLAVGQTATNIVQPGFDTLWDLGGEWRYGTSLALWTITKDEVPMAWVRGGYIIDYAPYVSLPVNLAAVAAWALPASWQATLAPGQTDGIWTFLGEHAIVGPWLGYNFDQEEDGNDADGGIVGGLALGGKLTF